MPRERGWDQPPGPAQLSEQPGCQRSHLVTRRQRHCTGNLSAHREEKLSKHPLPAGPRVSGFHSADTGHTFCPSSRLGAVNTTLYGGDLSLRNGLGDGTVFRIVMPAPPAPLILDIAQNGSQLVLSWPMNAPGNTPQSTPCSVNEGDDQILAVNETHEKFVARDKQKADLLAGCRMMDWKTHTLGKSSTKVTFPALIHLDLRILAQAGRGGAQFRSKLCRFSLRFGGGYGLFRPAANPGETGRPNLSWPDALRSPMPPALTATKWI